MLVGEATPVHISLNDRQLVTPTDEVNGQPQTYIVLMANTQNHASMGAQAETETAQARYTHLLQSMKQDSTSTLDCNADPSTTVPLHVYTFVCHGFSAVLTPQEASILRQKNGVLGIYPDTKYSLHTTRTPKFLALNPSRGLLPEAQFGTDVIIAVFDTGVWPERDSFSDEGLGPIPAWWRGICQTGQDFNASHCNKKLIGARYYVAGYERALLNETGKALNERWSRGHRETTTDTAATRHLPQLAQRSETQAYSEQREEPQEEWHRRLALRFTRSVGCEGARPPTSLRVWTKPWQMG